MSKQSNKPKQYRPSQQDPELLEFAVDVAKFSRKWKPTKIAKALGITKQSFNEHLEKKNKKGGTAWHLLKELPYTEDCFKEDWEEKLNALKGLS